MLKSLKIIVEHEGVATTMNPCYISNDLVREVEWENIQKYICINFFVLE
jgi:hypothetical protein